MLVVDFCKLVNCPALIVGRLVQTSPNNCVTSQMKISAKCSFSCPQGYQLQGPSYKHCGAKGQWTDSTKSISCNGKLPITGGTAMTSTAIFTFFLSFVSIILLRLRQKTAFIDVNEYTVPNSAATSVIMLQEAITVNVQIYLLGHKKLLQLEYTCKYVLNVLAICLQFWLVC